MKNKLDKLCHPLRNTLINFFKSPILLKNNLVFVNNKDEYHVFVIRIVFYIKDE